MEDKKKEEKRSVDLGDGKRNPDDDFMAFLKSQSEQHHADAELEGHIG